MHPLWEGWFLQIWKQGGTSGSGGTGVNQLIAGANIILAPAGGVGIVTVSGTDAPEVNQIVAGTNITISPAGGTGVVTVNAVDLPEVDKIVAGTNITISPVGGTGTVTINATSTSTNWPTIQNSTLVTDTLTIAAGFQMIVSKWFNNAGTIINNGQMVIYA
jgi:hypothetical protein